MPLPSSPGRYPIALAHLLLSNGGVSKPAVEAEVERIAIKLESQSAPALLRALQGQKDQALGLLEDSLANRDFNLLFVPMDPRYDIIRDHPRFVKIFQHIGLPAAP